VTVDGASPNDDDNFVFNFTPAVVKSFSLFMVKNEPDRIGRASGLPAYEYDFLIRDIVLSGEHYDFSAVYVSNPITIKTTGNTKNVIDAISMDASVQNVDFNSVDFYIAQNVPSASSINDFNWIPIAPTNFTNKSSSNVVNFYGKNLQYKVLSELNSTSKSPALLNTLSITASQEIPGYEGVPIYQVAELESNTDYVEPIVLSGFGKIKYYSYDYEENLCESIQTWTNKIIPEASKNNLQSSDFVYQKSSVFWTAPGIEFGGSALLSFELLASSQASLEETIIKNDNDSVLWDMAVYLNGVLLKRLKPGQDRDVVIWNFREGRNTVQIAIDAKPKETSGENGGLSGELVLTQKSFISDYGLIYQKYLSHINAQMYKNKNQVTNNTFAIDLINNKKYLISNSPIVPGSRLYYHVINPINQVDSVRVRADLLRSVNNPLSTPAITSYRLKFKSSQTLTQQATQSATDVLFGGSLS